MKRSIKVTPQQYQLLKEAIDNDFAYVTNDDSKPSDGLLNVTANGKTESDENGKPTTGDMVQQSLTPQGWCRFRSYGPMSRSIREGVNASQDTDFYDVNNNNNNPQLNILTNGNERDNLITIPQGVDTKIDILINAIKQNHLNPKQQAIVLNKIIHDLDYENIPLQWKKELINDLK